MLPHALRGLHGTGGQKALPQRFGLHDVAGHGIRTHTFLHVAFAGFRTGFRCRALGFLELPPLLFRFFLWFRAAWLSTCDTLLGRPRGPPSRLCPLEPGCAELSAPGDTRLFSTYLPVWRESTSSVAVSSHLALPLDRCFCVCSPAAACAKRRSSAGWVGGRSSWAVGSAGLAGFRGLPVGSGRCIASGEPACSKLIAEAPSRAPWSGLCAAAPADAAPGCLSGLRAGVRALSGLAASFTARGGGHGTGRSHAFLLLRATRGCCGSLPGRASLDSCSPPLLRAAAGAAPTQLLSASSARQASTGAGAVIAPGWAILRQVAEGVGGPRPARTTDGSDQRMPHRQ